MRTTRGWAGGLMLLGVLAQGAIPAATRVPATDSWIGAWGYVGAPLPPGMTPPPAPPPGPPVAAQPAVVPLGAPAPPAPPPPPRPAPPPPLLENPGNLPVEV